MLTIINDVHLGTERQAGTTPKTQKLLKEYIMARYSELLYNSPSPTVLVAGDLFDSFTVATEDLIEAYRITKGWLSQDHRNELILVAGNHDTSPKGDRRSSFSLFCEVLAHTNQTIVVDIDELKTDRDNKAIYLAHCSNQDVFNERLAKALELSFSGWHVFVHANVDNNFAVESDHSLNVSLAQAYEFKKKGVKLVFAHEHQARQPQDGNIIVMGNQFPTSVSDCLGNDTKFFHTLEDGKLTAHPFWEADDEFFEVNWRDTDTVPLDAKFVRVWGKATTQEASDVINAVSSLRRTHEAMVITNAVRVDGVAEISELPATFESARAFDVIQFIKEQLEPAEVELLDKLRTKL